MLDLRKENLTALYDRAMKESKFFDKRNNINLIMRIISETFLFRYDQKVFFLTMLREG